MIGEEDIGEIKQVSGMTDFQTFLDRIDNPDQRTRMKNILEDIRRAFPQLREEIKWNQPMFTDHGTFIIGFSVAKTHIAVAPEASAIRLFEKDIDEAGYSRTKELIRIKWTDPVDRVLLRKLVAYNIEEKKDTERFWR